MHVYDKNEFLHVVAILIDIVSEYESPLCIVLKGT